MGTIVPPTSDGNPPADGLLVVDGRQQALLLLEQIKKQVDAVEAWVQRLDARPAIPAPPPPIASPMPPPPIKLPPKPKKPGKKHRRHH